MALMLGQTKTENEFSTIQLKRRIPHCLEAMPGRNFVFLSFLILGMVIFSGCVNKAPTPLPFEASDGGVFLKSEANPILQGIPGTWEEVIESPMVIKIGDTYYMYYHGINPNAYPVGYQIGLATASSPSGPWERYPHNPILTHGQQGDWDQFAVAAPFVMKIEDTYYMWYCGQNLGVPDNYNIGLAFAPAPEGPWTEYSGNPILRVGEFPEWDYEGLYVGSVVKDRDDYYLFYSGFKERKGYVDYAQQLGLATATAPEGPWLKHPENPVLRPGSPGSWDEGAIGEAHVVYLDGSFHAWYWGSSTKWPAPDRAIGYAYSAGGVYWIKYPQNPLIDSGIEGESRLSEPHVFIEDSNIYLFCTQYDGFGLYTGKLDQN